MSIVNISAQMCRFMVLLFIFSFTSRAAACSCSNYPILAHLFPSDGRRAVPINATIRTVFNIAPYSAPPSLVCGDSPVLLELLREDHNDYQYLKEWYAPNGLPANTDCVVYIGEDMSTFSTGQETDTQNPKWSGQANTQTHEASSDALGDCGGTTLSVAIFPDLPSDNQTPPDDLFFELRPADGLPVWGVADFLVLTVGDLCINMDSSLGTAIDRDYSVTVLDEAGLASEPVELQVRSKGCSYATTTSHLSLSFLILLWSRRRKSTHRRDHASVIEAGSLLG